MAGGNHLYHSRSCPPMTPTGSFWREHQLYRCEFCGCEAWFQEMDRPRAVIKEIRGVSDGRMDD